MILKVYECDSCKKVIKDPYEVKIKEFYVGCSFETWGVFPSNDKRKVKIQLCDECFNGLNKIAKDKAERKLKRFLIHKKKKETF